MKKIKKNSSCHSDSMNVSFYSSFLFFGGCDQCDSALPECKKENGRKHIF